MLFYAKFLCSHPKFWLSRVSGHRYKKVYNPDSRCFLRLNFIFEQIYFAMKVSVQQQFQLDLFARELFLSCGEK